MQTMPKKHMCRWLLPGLLGLVLCAPVPNTYAATVEAGFSSEGTALQLVIRGPLGKRKISYAKDVFYTD